MDTFGSAKLQEEGNIASKIDQLVLLQPKKPVKCMALFLYLYAHDIASMKL
jgi:hypothetical protein